MDKLGEEGFQITLRRAVADFEARREAVEDLVPCHSLAQRLHDDERRRAGGEKFAAGGIKAKAIGLPGDRVKIEGGSYGVRRHRWGRNGGLQFLLLTMVANQGGKRGEFHGGG